MKRIAGSVLLIMLLCADMAGTVMAGGTKSVELQMHLVVTQPPPCTVQDLDVDLGVVRDVELDEAYNDIFIPISCTDNDGHNINLRIQGTPTSYSNAVLQTSAPGLGVTLETKNDHRLLLVGASRGAEINVSIPVGSNYQNVPLTVRIKMDKEELNEIEDDIIFNTTATLFLEYP
ncbi:hypothetical protein JAF83_002840 [Citrobacter werkmanii]|nr:hypothetical protein [Citrobacter werkmanii]